MIDLIVDASLDETNSNLKMINAEFDDIYSNATDDASIWGQADLADAMHDFADDWWAHRAKLQDRLKKLSDQVDKACSTWSEAEKQLSDSIGVSD